jgi:hypothetical protein
MKRIEQRLQRDFDRIADQAPASTNAWNELRARVAAEPDRIDEEVIMLTPTEPTTRRPRWVTPVAVAFGAAMILVVAGIVAVRTNDEPMTDDMLAPATIATTIPTNDEVDEPVIDDVLDPTIATTIPTTVDEDGADPEVTATVVVPAPDSWNPILATRRAKVAPPAAGCPAGTDPDIAGPIEQQRPPVDFWNLPVAFDQHAGRIVYVDRTGVETWTFDVCTNTWQRMNPTGAPIGERHAGLVYDVDSDLTIAFGFEEVSVYDANTNTWTQPSNDTVGTGDGLFVPEGAVYDSTSGLILTTWRTLSSPGAAATQELWAYDVDTNTWTEIGALPSVVVGDFLGYSQTIDRFIIVTGQDATALLDPRTGESILVSTESPTVNLGWPNFRYGPARDTVYVFTGDFTANFTEEEGRRSLCGFDTAVLTWTCDPAPYPASRTGGAPVGDPINDRVVLIGDAPTDVWDDVWAIDLDTAEWKELLASTSP